MSSQGSSDRRKENETKSRPINTFFVFLQEFRQQLKNSGFTSIPSQKISRLAGQRWRNMSVDEKLPYKIWARRNREQLREQEMLKEIRKIPGKDKGITVRLFFTPTGASIVTLNMPPLEAHCLKILFLTSSKRTENNSEPKSL
uniref:HMG box domain-containing protein n=1 Tax=Glossina pallidipes TaxID=7398 RepID=A0A1B0AA05_GLOPL